ncbi:DOPA 4,5-dioxygenase family protein [Bordetella bronchialis]|uniref:4,5-dioxygenase n=1 Tax=Bordetella bronchialis TaxID=463025 RepID=A0A193FCT0_9BORD|nr:DOPA 4,5-dioxygenase family protein [Bordetella bronchialis]ANN65587.1 4,5-dioxygenase [Bordetella bronchialis]ANN70616.1 4,5-dioxygenase [Bordetella bronchialis]
MIPADPARRSGESPAVESWHAHVYFDAATRDAAWALRERIVATFGAAMQMGRFHERPVGPHPRWSYQVAFKPEEFARIATWLALHHDGLDVFLHPNTGDALTDHRDRAIWIGRSHVLDLAVLGG